MFLPCDVNNSSNCSALVSRRALYLRSRCPVSVGTTRRTWTQTRRAFATCSPTTDEAKPKPGGTLCPPSCVSPSCKRENSHNVVKGSFIVDFVMNESTSGSQLCSLCSLLRVRDNNRVFKSSPHARQMKNSAVMTPPPIHINRKGNREVSTSLMGCSAMFVPFESLRDPTIFWTKLNPFHEPGLFRVLGNLLTPSLHHF